MFKSKSSQKRAISASNPFHSKQRMLSAQPQNKKNIRTHTQSYDCEQVTKPTRTRLYTSGMQNLSRKTQRPSKAPQELLQENLHLKIQLNDLNSKLHLTRSKIESQKKKHVLYSKRLNREFEKQLYWPNEKGSDYLITGIKHQYERLKQEYQEKCRQLQTVRQTIASTSIQEIVAYCESLQVQNKILIQNITYLKKNRRKPSKFQEINYPSSQFETADLQYELNEQRKKQEIFKSKIKSLQDQLSQRFNNEKQLSKKINFLEKLIIQTENDAYHACKKVKTIERQKVKLINEIKSFQMKITQTEQKHVDEFEEFKETTNRQAKSEKQIFQKLLRQKTITIQKLQKQIAYLSTLLSYWKPLDQIDRMDNLQQSSISKQKTLSLQNQSFNLNSGAPRQLTRSKTPVNLMMFGDDKNNIDETYLIRNSLREDLLISTNIMKESSLNTAHKNEFYEDRLQSTLNREPRKSTKKWSQDAKKSRKVELSQVQYLGQLIRFKMIAHKRPLNEVKQYFSCKAPKGFATKIEEQLITMKEIKLTLASPPFSLSESQAFLLSRYIIEDQGVEYVYCHQGNELQRCIVKSIVKTIVGDYEVPDFEKAEEKWKNIKKIYSHNMQLALRSICPKGIVSKYKFLELMNSLGIEADDETRNYLIAKMIENGNSLKEIRYDVLFNPEERVE